MKSLNLTNDALAFLENLAAKQYKQVVGTILKLLKNPDIQDSCALHGADYRRGDIGEYRIIYQHENEELKILLIGKRNDNEVYKRLKRKLK